jgi:hypothetical protein
VIFVWVVRISSGCEHRAQLVRQNRLVGVHRTTVQ